MTYRITTFVCLGSLDRSHLWSLVRSPSFLVWSALQVCQLATERHCKGPSMSQERVQERSINREAASTEFSLRDCPSSLYLPQQIAPIAGNRCIIGLYGVPN